MNLCINQWGDWEGRGPHRARAHHQPGLRAGGQLHGDDGGGDALRGALQARGPPKHQAGQRGGGRDRLLEQHPQGIQGVHSDPTQYTILACRQFRRASHQGRCGAATTTSPPRTPAWAGRWNWTGAAASTTSARTRSRRAGAGGAWTTRTWWPSEPDVSDKSDELLVSRSNCECEQIFHDCLKRVGTFTANTVGSLYFRTNRECLTLGHPKM